MRADFPGIGSLAFDERARDETAFIVKEIVEGGAYLGGSIQLLPGAVIIDAGANIGVFSRWVMKRLNGDCRVIAFEPVPDTRAWLIENLGDRAEVVGAALGRAPGRARMTTFPHLPGNATLWPDQKRAEFAAFKEATLAATPEPLRVHAQPKLDALFASAEVEVDVMDLATVFREFDLQRVDLLKIDVEGAEAEVLAGLDDEAWEKVRQIALEVNGDEAAAALASNLEARGFIVEGDHPQWAQQMSLDIYEMRAVRP